MRLMRYIMRTTNNEKRTTSQTPGRPAIVAVTLSLLALSLAMRPGESGAQEAVTQEAEPSTAASAPASPPPAPPAPFPEESVLVNVTGLVLQPPYLILRAPVALIGGLAGGMVWAASGGQDREGAQRIWETTVFQNWGWPEFVRALGASSAPAP
jgi:hypothetical protein